jgi:hypothetical protein
MQTESQALADAVLANPPPFENLPLADKQNAFPNSARDERAFGGELGIRKGAGFSPSELRRIQQIIGEHVRSRVAALSPEAADLVSSLPLERYHEISDRVEKMISEKGSHASIFSKAGRILSKQDVDELKAMSVFKYLSDIFGDYYLSDEENVGHEQVCFRMVRPNRREDVGALHRDDWFWQFYGYDLPASIGRTKLWTQICGNTAEAGLILVPGSHLVPGGFDAVNKNGKLTFVSKVDPSLPLQRFVGQLGQTVMFNYHNLHTGSINRGDTTRVSIEFTIMYQQGRSGR